MQDEDVHPVVMQRLIAAFSSPDCALACAVMQAGLFVAGLWGIFVFHEMKEPQARRVYWLSGLSMLLGVSLLALSR